MLSNETPLLYLVLMVINCFTYSSVASFASGKKLAARIPSIVVDLTPSARSVLESPPTEPHIQVNLEVRDNFSAALRIIAVESVVPNSTITGFPGTALNFVRAPSASAEVKPPAG